MTALEWTGEQAAGLGKGALEAAWGTVTGLGGLIMDPVGGFGAWVGGFIDDPLSLVITQEARDLFSEGKYGEAIGAGIVGFFGKKIPGKPPGNRGGGNDNGGNNNDNNGNDGNGNNNDEDNNGNNRDDEDEDSRPGATCSRGNSFVPGTEVLMADGARVPIEAVAVGDEVWAFDPATGEEGPRAVTDLIDSAGKKTLVDVEITDSAGETGSVTATEGHPFWVPQAGQWVDAAELDPGTWLRTSAGTWTQVTAVDVRTVDDQQTHNLTVADLHTYYVGAGDTTTLVHNSSNTPGEPPCSNVHSDHPNFRDHWKSKKGLLEQHFGKKYSKWKNGGDQEFVDDVQQLIDSGEVQFEGMGTLKKGEDPGQIFRGDDFTVVLREDGGFWTLLERGKGMDEGIQMVD